MKDILGVAIAFVPAVTCAAIAGYLAINRMDGWGWFLFVAVILLPSKVSVS